MHTRADFAVFEIEIAVPLTQADRFADALTGNDDDVILAAETAMRERVDAEEGEYEGIELEHYFDSKEQVVEFLRHHAAAPEGGV